MATPSRLQGATSWRGLTGAEGAVIDPLTGDFIFSTFGGGNEIDVISGFTVAPGVPESATWVMVLAGFGALATAFGARGRIATTS